MAEEQEVREHMGRAAVSRAAQRVDAADGEGRFATLELLVELGYKRGWVGLGFNVWGLGITCGRFATLELLMELGYKRGWVGGGLEV